MTQLINISIQGDNQVVNARDLHQFLESKQEFSNWIKNRISDYGFVKNEDFEVFDNFIKNPQGGRPSKDYAISLDMAKELSMVERNEKGREARKYFISVEKKLKQIVQTPKSSLLSSKQKVRKKRLELIQAIKNNLLRGDMADVARKHGFSIDTTQNVMRGLSFNPEIVKAMYDRAIERKQTLGLEINEMINQLNQ